MAARYWLAGAAMAASAAALFAQAVTPGPGRTIVFFDWGKPELGREAQAALDAVAEAYRKAPGERLRVVGHTDRSGSAATNNRSGLARARTVWDYLVARGVPAAAMAISSSGEEQPLVPTEDGVREVQNRRVEIIVGG